MKKVLTSTAAGIVALAAAVEATAQVMYEPFDYSTTNAGGNADVTNHLPTGSPPSSGNSPSFGRTNQTQGTFWSRAGAVTATYHLDNQITAGSLTAPAALPDAIGNKANAAATSNVDRIGFGQVVNSGRVYYSLLLKFDATPGAISRVLGLNTFALDSSNNTTALASALTTQSAAGGYQVGVTKNAGGATFDSRVWTTSDTLFVVGAYQINNPGTVGSDDVSYMWVNPSDADFGAEFSGADPGPVTNRLTNTSGTAPSDYHDGVGGGANTGARMPVLASFFLRANGTASQWRVDELRIDSTWAGVTPRKDLQYTWNDAGGGSFNDPLKWNSNAGAPNPNPNSLGAVAVFGPGITGPAAVTTAGETVDTITFDNANSITVDGTGLTVSTNASAGQIIAKQGSHTVSAPLTLNDDLVIKAGTDATGAGGATVTLSGAVTEGTVGAKTIGKYGLGTLRLGASNILPDNSTLAVRVGTLDLNGNNETVANVVLGAGHRNTAIDVNSSPQLAAGVISGAGSLSATGTFQLENGSVSAVLGGTGAVVKTTQGAARLSGASTYTGDTTIRAGTLLVGADAPAGAAGALGNSTAAIILSDAGTVAGAVDPGSAPKNGEPVALLTDGPVTIGRNVLVNPQGTPTLGGNSAHASTFSGSITLTRNVPHVDPLLKQTTLVTAATGGTVSFTGPITEAATGAVLEKVGAGTVVLGAANTYTGGTTVNAGTLVVGHGDALGGGNLVVNNAAAQAQPGLTKAVSVNALSFTGSGKLDLTDNDLVIKSGTLAGVTAQIVAGYNNGTWDGTGINSSSAATDPNADTAIGFFDNAEVQLTSFSGVTLTGPEIVVKYTYYGDADLTGVVDTDDFQLFLAGYQDNTLPRTWFYGDFDYTGVIDTDDFQVFLYGYQNQGGALSELSNAVASAEGISAADRAFMQAAIAAVPEPTSLGMLALAGAGVLGRRTRRNRA